jgi:hypothetical protein
VLDPAVADFKVSARRFLDQADAALVMGNMGSLEDMGPMKNVFQSERGVWLTPEIIGFLRQRLIAR